MVIFDKKKIKQKALFDPPLLKMLDSESVAKKQNLEAEIKNSVATGTKIQIKVKKDRLEVLKAATPALPVATSMAKVLHGLNVPTLTQLKKQDRLPYFTQNSEAFEKQPMLKKADMAGETIDSDIIPAVLNLKEQIRAKKRRREPRKAIDVSKSSLRPSYLDRATKDLIIDFKKIRLADPVADNSEIMITVDERTNAGMDSPLSKGSPIFKSSSNKNLFLLRKLNGPPQRSLERPTGNTVQLSVEMSQSSLIGNHSQFLTPKKLPEASVNMPGQRSVFSIQAGELYPRLKTLFRDSAVLLARKPRPQDDGLHSSISPFL